MKLVEQVIEKVKKEISDNEGLELLDKNELKRYYKWVKCLEITGNKFIFL